MQADDEKCLAAETQRKVRIARIGTDAAIERLPVPGILVGQRFQPLPQACLEFLFVEPAVFLEQHRQRLEEGRRACVGPGEIEQGRINTQIVPRRSHVASDKNAKLALGERGLRPDAREMLIPNEGREATGERVVIVKSW